MTAKHADFEALSAYVDGEAPEWADHVAGCPGCRATAAELRALSARVAAPADPPAAEQREAAITAAVGAAALDAGAGDRAPEPLEPAAAARQEAQRGRFGRSWGSRPWAMPAVAAVVVALLGVSGVILSADRSTDENATTFAGPALDTKAESAVPGAPTAPVGDLGDVPDAVILRARALAVGAGSAAGAPSAVGRSSANSGTASDAQASATNTGNTGASVSSGAAGGAGGSANVIAPPDAAAGASGVPSAGGGAAVIVPNVVGARPCEEQARAREAGLGPVTYFATARHRDVPAYVLGFSADGGGSITLLMLAQDGCSELLRSAGP